MSYLTNNIYISVYHIIWYGFLAYKNQPTTEEPGIPGPNPILILAIVFLGIIGLTWQRKKNLK
ncbi:MAG: hypothetical protein ACFE8M_04710 [Candidatus Hermodarchaeota archaeon]